MVKRKIERKTREERTREKDVTRRGPFIQIHFGRSYVTYVHVCVCMYMLHTKYLCSNTKIVFQKFSLDLNVTTKLTSKLTPKLTTKLTTKLTNKSTTKYGSRSQSSHDLVPCHPVHHHGEFQDGQSRRIELVRGFHSHVRLGCEADHISDIQRLP